MKPTHTKLRLLQKAQPERQVKRTKKKATRQAKPKRKARRTTQRVARKQEEQRASVRARRRALAGRRRDRPARPSVPVRATSVPASIVRARGGTPARPARPTNDVLALPTTQTPDPVLDATSPPVEAAQPHHDALQQLEEERIAALPDQAEPDSPFVAAYRELAGIDPSFPISPEMAADVEAQIREEHDGELPAELQAALEAGPEGLIEQLQDLPTPAKVGLGAGVVGLVAALVYFLTTTRS